MTLLYFPLELFLMKQILFSLSIALLSLSYLPSLQAAPLNKKTVSINFNPNTNEEAQLITQNLTSSLNNNPALEILQNPSTPPNYTLTANISKTSTPESDLIINLQIHDSQNTKLIYAKKLTINNTEAPNKEQLAKKSACLIANTLIETLFPITINSVEGAYVYLKHEIGSRLKTGMKIEVLIPSAHSVDPTTGEVIKGSEFPIGELKITETQPDIAKAQIIRYGAPIERGALCRTIPNC